MAKKRKKIVTFRGRRFEETTVRNASSRLPVGSKILVPKRKARKKKR